MVLMMYAVLAIGLDLLLGWSGQFAFAHIAFFGVGITAPRSSTCAWAFRTFSRCLPPR